MEGRESAPFFLGERNMTDKYCQRATGDVPGRMNTGKANTETGMVTDGADLDSGYERIGSAERDCMEKMNFPGVRNAG